ncbi:N5-carboxyaminoimidazole ribonucleotide mutase [bacterium BMS3Abin10]|nr:N5-carboxyaminoimidazole ribonucleotide mutase [bacterium BMS3Abin10]GBE39884.1 N5-carboxyaminoimidazole ribonucleotide mutase [bacterium BMS3Bbin08]HDH50872.1 5-(carboxyamino)imidazole ribonucleotide mutase [Nitrospirota bacterium]HDK17122.1 5-(carboxyamino)imidazole ribonucleotide mutase [Nitrospirota bacterium]
MKSKVLIIMGSDSDLPTMQETVKVLKKFKIPYEITVASAHRSPKRTVKLTMDAEKNGIEVIIAGAGAAAHLAGVIAAHTTLPVIGIPIDSSPLKGIDALFSTVQMPPGIPVATMAIGKAGAKNAAIFAAQIIQSTDPGLAKTLRAYKKKMALEVLKKAKKIKKNR